MPPMEFDRPQFQEVLHFSHVARKMETQKEVEAMKQTEAVDRAKWDVKFAEAKRIYASRPVPE